MATYTKNLLSASTNGKGIKITATAPSGTLLHTAVTGVDSLDEVYLYASNTASYDVTLTIEWGGVNNPDDNIIITLPPKSGGVLVVAGLLIQNSLLVKAYASETNRVTIFGFVNSIT